MIGSTDAWDATLVTPSAVLSASAAVVSASSLTVAELNMSSTSYVVEDSRRLFPDEAAVATQAPSPELIPAPENAFEHAVSSSTAAILAVSLCTLAPAMAASARSLAFAFNLASAMSARMESRVSSATFSNAWADGGGGGGDTELVHAVASPPGTVSPGSRVEL